MEPTVVRLITAEKKVNEVVKQAQDKKLAKLQNIKGESKPDLDEFKEVMQSRYEEALATKRKEIEQQLSNKGNEKSDEEILAAIEIDYNENEDAVVAMLIGNIMNVNIDIPKVVKGNFEEND